MAMPEKDIRCGFCRRGHEASGVCGELHIHTTEVSAHHKCMQYSALLTQYKFSSFGGFKIEKVAAEIKRGRFTKCSICRKSKSKLPATGATCGCAIKSCRRTFHYFCAHEDREAITKRLEVTKDDTKQKVVLYRVFCSKEHQKMYENNTSNKIEYVSDSDPDGESDDEQLPHSQSSVDSQKSGQKKPMTPTCSPMKTNVMKVPPLSRSPVKRIHPSPSTTFKKAPPSNPAIQISAGGRTPQATSSSNALDSDSDENDEGSGPPGNSASRKRSRTATADQSDDNEISSRKRTLGTLTYKEKSSPSVRDSLYRQAVQNRMVDSDVASNASSDADFQPPSPKKKYTSAKRETAFKLRVQANPEDCVICFPESGRGNDNLSGVMQQMAKGLYGVPNSSVYFWQYSSECDTLTNEHMVHLHNDISSALCQNDFAKVQRLVFDLSDKDIIDYTNLVKFNHELGEQLEKKILQKVRTTIKENFLQAEAVLKEDVGCVKFCEALQVNILFLRVCNVIDPGHVIRSRLGHQADLVQWDENTTLCNFSCDSLAHYQSHEKETFLKWLGKNVTQPQILTYPEEKIFLNSFKPSTTYRLMKDYQKKPNMSQSNNILVFLGPVDEEVVNFDMYVRKMIPQLIQQRLTERFIKIYCVLDVGSNTNILAYKDIIGEVPPFADVRISSAQDPRRLPVTTVLLSIAFKDDPHCTVAL